LGIWKNIGKIVSLAVEISILEVEWYLFGIHKKKKKRDTNDTPKHSGVGTSEIYSGVSSNYEPLSEEEESRQRSNLMVELCEQPYYKND
jgi:hypothetical protein